MSGSPDLTSPSGFVLTAGDDIEVVSDTDLRSRADSDAVLIGLGWAQANSENEISDVNTVALLGNGTSTNAGDTVLVHAEKLVGTSVTANVIGLGSSNPSDSITANTAAIVTGTATSIGGSSITGSVVDPMVSKVKSTVTDRIVRLKILPRRSRKDASVHRRESQRTLCYFRASMMALPSTLTK